MSIPNTILRVALLLMVPCLPLARGDEVTRQVQEELRKRNLYFGDVDGRRTEQVAAALRRYQQRKGFASTGQADETTLRSLTLLPPAPRIALASPPPAGPVAGFLADASPWPDVTVLRSDSARPGPVPADLAPVDIEPSPTPTIAPPPTAAAVRRPSETAVRTFLADYLRAGQSNDTEIQMPFYGGRVDYFDDGKVDLHYIHGDIDKYDRLWPERRFTLLDPIALSSSPDHDPDKIIVNFHYRFAEKRRHDAPEGETANTYTLQRTGLESFQIIGMKESRVRSK